MATLQLHFKLDNLKARSPFELPKGLRCSRRKCRACNFLEGGGTCCCLDPGRGYAASHWNYCCTAVNCSTAVHTGSVSVEFRNSMIAPIYTHLWASLPTRVGPYRPFAFLPSLYLQYEIRVYRATALFWLLISGF